MLVVSIAWIPPHCLIIKMMKKRSISTSPRHEISEPPAIGESVSEEYTTSSTTTRWNNNKRPSVTAQQQLQPSSSSLSRPSSPELVVTSSSSPLLIPRCFYRKSTWLQIVLPIVILTRCGWNIHWFHSRWFTESFLAITQIPPEGMRRTTFIHNKNVPKSSSYHQQQKRHQETIIEEEEEYVTTPEEFVVVPVIPSRKQPPEDELQLLEQRRLQRQQRTRPVQGPNQNDDIEDISDLSSGYWFSMSVEDIYVTPVPDWSALCKNASLSKQSRVVISGILSQPPSQALALLLAHHCKVDTIAGVDPLFPNIRQNRIKSMDDYRVLKRAIKNLTLIVPAAISSSGDDDDDDDIDEGDDSSVQQLYDFDPTHVILVETFVPNLYKMMDELRANHYMAKYRMKLVKDVLTATAAASKHKPTTKFVRVTSAAVSDHLTSHFQTVLMRTFYGLYYDNFSVVQLLLPEMFGPYVTDGDEPDEFELERNVTLEDSDDERMYVDEAVTAILQSLQVSSGWKSIKAHPTLNSFNGTILASNGTEMDLDEVLEFRESETKTWMMRDYYEHLGNAHIEAEYINTFGVPRNRFPCSSRCESVQCIPSVFESIKEVAREATEGCDYVLYITDFSRYIDSLEELRPEVEDYDEEKQKICRVAFVSGKSALVRDAIRQAKDDKKAKITKDVLLSENGKLIVNDWRAVWLPDDDEKSLSKSDRARLRVDPAGMFAPSVTKALYTQVRAFKRARLSQLNDTFAEMYRERVPRRLKKVRRPGTNVFQKTVIHRQRPRKVIFLAKEPKYSDLPDSLADFLSDVEAPIPPKQIEFYNESERLIFSPYMRPMENIREIDFDTMPYYWVSPKFFVHDLKTKQSQDFRCHWYMEYLHWDNKDQDGELLSLAYVMARGLLTDKIGERDEESTSWIPLMNPDYPGHRMKNAKSWELFIRIQQS